MPRSAAKPDDLATIEARRETLREELAALDQRAKAIEIAARDAGRPVLLAALDRVKIGAIEKADARVIAQALSDHGGKAVAANLTSLT
ncbi:hypothetical protein [Sphingomonas sp. RB3P16]|uniref:hypothetical protein n=1 Tax=Parasphingomonas frigoris TaxID=3096163 RepID=UPI002FC96BFA